MKDIKVLHVMIALILFLAAVATVQWMQMPSTLPPRAAVSSEEAVEPEPEELPPLSQNDLYTTTKQDALAITQESPLPDKSIENNELSPKDPDLNDKMPTY